MPHPVWLGGTNVCKKNYPCQFSVQCATFAGTVCRVPRGAVPWGVARCAVCRGVRCCAARGGVWAAVCRRKGDYCYLCGNVR